MTSEAQRQQIDRNYDAFQRCLATLLPGHRNDYALLRDGAVVDFYSQPGAAFDAGKAKFADGLFSIQQVTDEPVHLGFWSLAAD